ncbi:MAG: ATP-binding cassette domain-containing protein [Deltaproteobacteria bacterium]|nr:ATP-binding cassette domain-containing protein [Deltaproteobacteria bacterium]
MIRFVGLSKSFGSKSVLDGVDVSIGKGEVFFIIGQSGVGKSVLIKHLIGLLRPDRGEIYLDDQEISRLTERQYFAVRRRCGMVFQHSTLFDSLTCIENVALPIRKHKHLGKKKALVEARKRLEQVHMEEFAETFPAALGDGMRKRVAIARTLTMDPEFVLFDEPTTGLDPVSARRVDVLIRELADRLHVTCVVVSHDLTSIFSIADRIVMLYKGKVRLLGTRDEFRRSADPVVRQFITGSAEGPME